MSVWTVRGSYGLWVVRAETEQEAIEVTFSGPDLGSGACPAEDYGMTRGDLSATRVEDGPAGIVEGMFA